MTTRFRGPASVARRKFLTEGVPDPWSKEEDAEVRMDDAIPLCLHCLSPQNEHAWFCPNCGYPTGEYVPVMPFLYIFLQGEFFARGTTGHPETSFLKMAALVVVTLCTYSILAPIYWYRMLQKQKGHPVHSGRMHIPTWATDRSDEN